MNETKIYEKLLEHDEDLKVLKQDVQELKVSMHGLQDNTDKILHIVERLDQERAATNYHLDESDTRVSKLEAARG
ncbi:MAG: hypothetical protein JNK33_03225 [Candidatus Doudnabacteria bacterium]|nr:hypothetical protein [Candidatus Doudnabacteria bacterium]